jgi:hypothetical protein
MPLLPDAVPDFVATTLKFMPVGRWVDLSLEYTEYVWASMVAPRAQSISGGIGVSFPIQVKNTETARPFGLFATDVTRVEDVMITANLPWSATTVSWSYDVMEPVFQSDRETIVEQLRIREHQAKNNMADRDETYLWSAPTGPTDNVLMGIPFWMQKYATSTDGAFGGGDPAGFTSGAAGIATATYPRWRNWVFKYTQYTVDDLIRKVKKSMFNTRFQAPVPHPELGFGKADYQIFTTYRVVEPLERLAETRNDNLGADLAKYLGQVVIGGVPMKAVPYLEYNDTSDPLYGVNWKALGIFTLKGGTMKRTFKDAPNQHNVKNVFLDNWKQMGCYNRRALWVGSI